MPSHKTAFVAIGLLFSGLVLVLFQAPRVQEVIGQEPGVVTLRSGTLVPIKLNEQASSGDPIGKDISASVTMDVKVGGRVVVKAGTRARVTAGSTEKAGMIGGGGKVTLTVHSTEAIDGQPVALSGTAGAAGEGKMGTTIALGVVVCPLFLLMRGEEAVVPPGTEIRAFVASDVQVRVPELR